MRFILQADVDFGVVVDYIKVVDKNGGWLTIDLQGENAYKADELYTSFKGDGYLWEKSVDDRIYENINVELTNEELYRLIVNAKALEFGVNPIMINDDIYKQQYDYISLNEISASMYYFSPKDDENDLYLDGILATPES